MVQWGKPIPVDEQRPDWLRDDDLVRPHWTDSSGWYPQNGVRAKHVFWKYCNLIRLSVDHPRYHMVAAPASYRGEIDPPTVTAEFIALVVNERDALRKRVTDLLEANNRLVERNRVLQEFQAAFERSQDELATVRTKLDMLKSTLRGIAA